MLRLRTFLCVFQRWAKAAKIDTVVPQPFVQALAERVLEPKVTLSLKDDFQLRLQHQRTNIDSSATTCIFGFYSEVGALNVQYVRRSDNDTHKINLKTKMVESIAGHWMAGDSKSCTPIEPAMMCGDSTSGKALRDRWFDPQRWLDEGRAVLVRPTDKAVAVPLCESSARALEEGRTLLLIKGDLVHVPIPGTADIYIAGMSWFDVRERNTTSVPDEPSCDPSGLTFILAERATRKAGGKENSRDEEHIFDGKVASQPRWKYGANGGQPLFTESGMFDWQAHDVYEYGIGRWS